jgi:hypothetical protein
VCARAHGRPRLARTDLSNARRDVAAACGADAALPIRQVVVLVRQHWPAILRVAAALQERGMLSGSEIEGLIRDG